MNREEIEKAKENLSFMNIENYKEIKFVEYVEHKGEPDWEIAWNKKMLDLIDKDPTGGLKEKRLQNIEYWEKRKTEKC